MKKSMIRKIESLLTAMVNGNTSETLKRILRSPEEENKPNASEAKFSFKFLQMLR